MRNNLLMALAISLAASGVSFAASTVAPLYPRGGLSEDTVIYAGTSTLNGLKAEQWGASIDGKNPITTVTATTSPAVSAAPTSADVALYTLAPSDVTVITLGNGGASGRAQIVEVEINQPSTGGFAVTFSGAIAWRGGATPVVSTAAGDKTFIRFLTTDGGQTYIGGI